MQGVHDHPLWAHLTKDSRLSQRRFRVAWHGNSILRPVRGQHGRWSWRHEKTGMQWRLTGYVCWGIERNLSMRRPVIGYCSPRRLIRPWFTQSILSTVMSPCPLLGSIPPVNSTAVLHCLFNLIRKPIFTLHCYQWTFICCLCSSWRSPSLSLLATLLFGCLQDCYLAGVLLGLTYGKCA